MFDTVKNQFETVYGEAQPFSTESGHSGYFWSFEDDQGNPYQAMVKTYPGDDDGNLYFTASIYPDTDGQR